MKIHSEQNVEAVRQEQAKAKNKADAAPGFDNLLNEEVSKSGTAAKSNGAPLLQGPTALNPLLQTQMIQKTGETQSTEETVMNTVEDALQGLDNYAARIGSSDASLKSAYAELEEVSGRMDQLKEDFPDLAEKNPGLQSIVDEVSVLTQTEKIKFNRGDYL